MEHAESQRDIDELGMWIFLATEVMFFGGLFGGYTVYSLYYPEGFAAGSNHMEVPIGLVNTLVLLTSSFTMALAVGQSEATNRRKTVLYLSATAFLGIVFLLFKGLEYYHHYEHGVVPAIRWLYPEKSKGETMFMTLYFIMTGLHAAHLIIGISLIMLLAFVAWRKIPGNAVHVSGLYWHFVDIIWVFLFPLLYLLDRA